MPAITRRILLERCLSAGVLTFAIPTTVAEVAEAWEQSGRKHMKLTPEATAGPFYRESAPMTAKLRQANDPGMPLTVSGNVYSESGEALPNAKIEIWQTDHLGQYDLKGDRYRASVVPGKPEYSFESVMPGHYPGRIAQHIHYLVSAPGHKPLTTQLCFATDPAFEGDPGRTYSRDPLIPSQELIRPVIIKGFPKQLVAAVNFDLVLAKS